MKHNELALQRNPNTYRSSRKIIPSTNYTRSSSSSSFDFNETLMNKPLVQKYASSPPSTTTTTAFTRRTTVITTLLRSIFNLFSFPTNFLPTCKWLSIPTHLSITPSLGRKITGTLFGHRKGHVTFAVQFDPKSEPALLIELATSTSALVKEMSSGLVRIALETEKSPVTCNTRGGKQQGKKLFQEPVWTMYCNGRKCGYAQTRACSEFDRFVLGTVQSVSAGAGVIPVVDDGRKSSASEGELLYMRAKFERVVGSRDSEAFYMMNPDGSGGPELSIFLLRL